MEWCRQLQPLVVEWWRQLRPLVLQCTTWLSEGSILWDGVVLLSTLVLYARAYRWPLSSQFPRAWRLTLINRGVTILFIKRQLKVFEGGQVSWDTDFSCHGDGRRRLNYRPVEACDQNTWALEKERRLHTKAAYWFIAMERGKPGLALGERSSVSGAVVPGVCSHSDRLGRQVRWEVSVFTFNPGQLRTSTNWWHFDL